MKTSAQSNFLLASERSDDLIFDTNVPARQHGGMSFVPIWAFPLGICALATAFLLGIGKAASIATGAATSAKDVQALRLQCGAGMMDCKNALEQNGGDFQQAAEWLRKKGITSADKKTSRIAAEGVIGQYIHMGSRIGVLIEVNCETDFVARGEVFKSLVENLAMQVAACQNVTIIDTNDADPVWLAKECEIEMGKEDLKSKPQQIREKIVEGRVQKRVKEIALLEQPFIRDQDKTVSEVVKEAIAAVGEKIKVRRFAKFVLGEGLEKRSSNFAADVAAQAEIAAKKVTEANPTEELQASPAETDAMQVSAKTVSELRRKSAAGILDCKKALEATNGDMDAAAEWLRKKGLVSAHKKASRIAAEGMVTSYIHTGNRLGVLLELNCETDFVARGDAFNQLAADLAMQVAACDVLVVAAEDVDPSWLAKEREIEMGKEDLKSKPEQIRAKIVEGRVQKRVKEVALLEQPFIKDQDKTVKEVLKAAISTIGENIKIRRFERFVLGEGLEKRSNNFAEEVAATTGKV
eukprot:GGOE01056530.1.p1 GENE.GGOE01056530.1~~GGOE01056530.1.p1  ORF type:complete len:600 (-),score=160.76 GGOE01056530.1:218-1786(-)